MQLPSIPYALIGRGLTLLRDWRSRPVLSISFDPNQTHDVRAVTDYGGAAGRFCHFIVSNTPGKAIARRCRARLMSVDVLTAHGEPRPAPGFVATRTLKWANEPDFEPRDIESDVPRRADLCYAVDGYPGLWFFAGPIGVGVQTVFPTGNYRVRVRVDAENANYVDAVFDVSYDGAWTTISVTPRPT